MIQRTVTAVLTVLLLYRLHVVYAACIVYVGVRTYHDHQLSYAYDQRNFACCARLSCYWVCREQSVPALTQLSL